MRLRLGTLTTLSVAVLASGCSGGGQSSAPVVPSVGKIKSAPAHGSAKARLTIKMPIRKTGTAAKSSRVKPQYVSNGTAGIGIRAGSSDPNAPDAVKNAAWQLFDVSGNSSLCSTSGSVRTCVISVTAPLDASDEFQIDATDTAPLPTDTVPTGNLLSSGDTTTTVALGAENPVSVSLTGVIGSLAMSGNSAFSVWAAPGATASVIVALTANDFANGMISGNPATFQNPIIFSDGFGHTSPFTYPSGDLNATPANYGLAAPLTPGPIVATVQYSAPQTWTAASTSNTVTVSTMVPNYLPTPTPPSVWPTTTFTLNPMVVSVGGNPVANVPNLVVGGPDVAVTVNEAGALISTVTNNTGGAVTVGQILPTLGATTFNVHAVSPTSDPASTIVVTDANGTAATLSVTVAATASPSPTPSPAPSVAPSVAPSASPMATGTLTPVSNLRRVSNKH